MDTHGQQFGRHLGRHILVEYYDAPADLLNDVDKVEAAMLAAAAAAEANVIQSTFHHFSPIGVSGVLVIQESHLAIHTWPELGYAAVDIFTCGSDINPWPAYHSLKESLQAAHGSAMELLRGQSSLFSSSQQSAPISTEQSPSSPIFATRSNWFTSRDEHLALSLKYHGQRLYLHQSTHQKVEVYDTLAYGRMLVADGRILFTEQDEYIFHEMMVHVAMQTALKRQRILVMGGGDGGIVRELLRYPDTKHIHVVEIDQGIEVAAQTFFPQLAAVMEHPKVQISYQDGLDYVQTAEQESYDVILVDFEIGTFISDREDNHSFFSHLHRLLSHEGILIVQSEAPRFTPDRFRAIHQHLHEIFGSDQVHPYLAYIPTLPTGTWSFAYCSKGHIDPLHLLERSSEKQRTLLSKLRYYNHQVHQAAFALPNDLKQLCE